jgi:hypothetical protein
VTTHFHIFKEGTQMPLLFWTGAPVLVLLWSQVVWGAVHLGSNRIPPWWIGRYRAEDRLRVIFFAGLAGFVTMGLATTHSMPWHATAGQLLFQRSWTWVVAMAVATTLPAGATWFITRSRRRVT